MTRFLSAIYKFGLVGGFFCVLAFWTFHWMDLDPTNLSMLFGYIMVPIFLFLGIRFYRKYHNQGELSFWEGFGVGFLIYSIIALISGLGIWISLLFNEALFESIKATKMLVLDTNKENIISQLGEKSFLSTFERLSQMKPFDIALNDFIWKIIPGLFFTIIISIILRKTKTTT